MEEEVIVAVSHELVIANTILFEKQKQRIDSDTAFGMTGRNQRENAKT